MKIRIIRNNVGFIVKCYFAAQRRNVHAEFADDHLDPCQEVNRSTYNFQFLEHLSIFECFLGASRGESNANLRDNNLKICSK